MTDDRKDEARKTPSWQLPQERQPDSDAYHIWTPRPLLRSVYWKPVPAPPFEAVSASYEIFVDQRAWLTMHEHVWQTPGEKTPFGYLVGDLCEDPNANRRFVNITAALPARFDFHEDATEQISREATLALQLEVERRRGVLAGWYHRHLGGEVRMSGPDVQTHHQHFVEPWQCAFVFVAGGDRSDGGCFRSTPEAFAGDLLLPFYEMASNESLLARGVKRSYLDWSNYSTVDEIRSEPPPRPHIEIPLDGPEREPALPEEASEEAGDVGMGRAAEPSPDVEETSPEVEETSLEAEPPLESDPPAQPRMSSYLDPHTDEVASEPEAAEAEAEEPIAAADEAEEPVAVADEAEEPVAAADEADEAEAPAAVADEVESVDEETGEEEATVSGSGIPPESLTAAEEKRADSSDVESDDVPGEVEVDMDALIDRVRPARIELDVQERLSGEGKIADTAGREADEASRKAATADDHVAALREAARELDALEPEDAKPRGRRPVTSGSGLASHKRAIAASIGGLLVIAAVVAGLLTLSRDGETGSQAEDASSGEVTGGPGGGDGSRRASADSLAAGGVTAVQIDSVGRDMLATISRFYGRAVAHDNGNATCEDLAAAYVAVENAWIRYNTEYKAEFNRPLPPELSVRDERLYAGVQDADREFERSACPRP